MVLIAQVWANIIGCRILPFGFLLGVIPKRRSILFVLLYSSAPAPLMISAPESAQALSGIDILRLLWIRADYIPFGCTMLFSFLVPVCKFLVAALMLCLAAFGSNSCRSRWVPYKIMTVLRTVCKYQLVDAFSVLLIITFINLVGIEADLLAAAYSYLCYCFFSILSTQWMCHSFAEGSILARRTVHCSKAISLSCPLLQKQDNMEIEEGALCNIKDSPCLYAHATQREAASHEKARVSSFTETLFHGGSTNATEITLEKRSDVMLRGIISRRSRKVSEMQQLGQADMADDLVHEIEGSVYNIDRPDHLESCESGQCHRGEDGQWFSGWDHHLYSMTAVFRPIRFLCTTIATPVRIGVSICSSVFRTICCFCRPCFYRGLSQRRERPYSFPFIENDRMYRGNGDIMESKLRTILLFLTFAVFNLSLWVLWNRPIITVSIVPGRHRDFAIDSWDCSFGDVIRSLYSRHLFSACVLFVVFPIITTLFLYVSCICTMMGLWILDSGPAGSARMDSFMHHKSKAAVFVVKHGSFISGLLADLAMADVLALGLVTAFFIINNVDFLGARIPVSGAAEPSGILRLLNGFGAAMAMGISASQVHSLQVPREAVADRLMAYSEVRAHGCDDLRCTHQVSNLGTPGYGDSALPVSQRGVPSYLFACSESKRMFPGDAIGVNGAKKANSAYSKRRVLLNGCVRLLAAALLLHPCWLESAGILVINIEQVVGVKP